MFSAYAVGECFTDSSFSSDDDYYSYSYSYSYNSSMAMKTPSSAQEKLFSKAMSKIKSSYSSESVGTNSYYYYAPSEGPSEWSCYNPNQQDDGNYYYNYYYGGNSSYYYYGGNSSYYYYGYYGNGSTSSVTNSHSNKRSSRSLASSYLYTCAPYTATNTSSGLHNYAVCTYTYDGVMPIVITGTLLFTIISQLI